MKTISIAGLALFSIAHSFGQNLVPNGYGESGDNSNFSQLAFDGQDFDVGSGSFYAGSRLTVMSDEQVPYQADKAYLFEFSHRSRNYVAGNRQYAFVDCYDVDGLLINDGHVLYLGGTTTTLSQPLDPGDQYVYLSDISGWSEYTQHYRRGFKIWNYQNSFGYTYPPDTYTRYLYQDLWDFGQGIESASSRIRLRNPWAGPTVPAGTAVSQNQRGGTYLYTNSNFEAASGWQRERAVLPPGGARPGTAYIGVGWLADEGNHGNQFSLSGVSLTQLPYSSLSQVDGNLGIGVPDPSMKLEVNGTIRVMEVVVEASPWPDYVFESGYELRSLSEVEAHILEHRRLPGVSGAADVGEAGVSLGDNQRILLEKIEELTLYAIEQEKALESKKQRIEALENRLSRIEALLAK